MGQVVEEAVAVLVLPASLLVTVEREVSTVRAAAVRAMEARMLLAPAATARRE
jgi:hypothetical protein